MCLGEVWAGLAWPVSWRVPERCGLARNVSGFGRGRFGVARVLDGRDKVGVGQ